MPPRSKQPKKWLLSVASAGALLPACADEHIGGEAQGIMVLPDAGQPGSVEAGQAPGLVAYPDSGFQGGGVIVQPWNGPMVPTGAVIRPDSSVGDALDASATDAAPNDAAPNDAAPNDAGKADAGKGDAGCPPFLAGIVITPSDASCMPFYPGIMPRNDPEP